MSLFFDEYCHSIIYSMSDREREKTTTQKEEALTIKYKGYDYLNTYNDINMHRLTLEGITDSMPSYSVAQSTRLNGFI